ncbi:hypothetical protein EVAR_359_1 [Eumeta japonica]|uniref:Uncharacterized protein n=1 Tax=Eumeta variegata TaxID=151549 RepID=A0A4C1SCZ5_EUMVA|nr:hypothetical protein EVAR_359_1 [Eumeta japonica]
MLHCKGQSHHLYRIHRPQEVRMAEKQTSYLVPRRNDLSPPLFSESTHAYYVLVLARVCESACVCVYMRECMCASMKPQQCVGRGFTESPERALRAPALEFANNEPGGCQQRGGRRRPCTHASPGVTSALPVTYVETGYLMEARLTERAMCLRNFHSLKETQQRSCYFTAISCDSVVSHVDLAHFRAAAELTTARPTARC